MDFHFKLKLERSGRWGFISSELYSNIGWVKVIRHQRLYKARWVANAAAKSVLSNRMCLMGGIEEVGLERVVCVGCCSVRENW